MVEYTCTRCGKSFSKLWKLHHHNKRKYKYRPKIIPQITIPQVKNQKPEAGPGPTTQAYRKEQTTIQQVIDQEK
ncbi:30698_t:CDS:1, partial [Racocetra persica]